MREEPVFVAVATFASPGEAHLAWELLQSAGIAACLAREEIPAAAWTVTTWPDRFRHVVTAQDAALARKVMAVTGEGGGADRSRTGE